MKVTNIIKLELTNYRFSKSRLKQNHKTKRKENNINFENLVDIEFKKLKLNLNDKDYFNRKE